MAIKKVAKKTTKKSAKKVAESVARKPFKNVTSQSDIIAGPPKAFPPGISNPATRALRNIGVTRLSQLAEHREADLAVLHGMGPKGVKVLKAALKAVGRSFRS